MRFKKELRRMRTVRELRLVCRKLERNIDEGWNNVAVYNAMKMFNIQIVDAVYANCVRCGTILIREYYSHESNQRKRLSGEYLRVACHSGNIDMAQMLLNHFVDVWTAAQHCKETYGDSSFTPDITALVREHYMKGPTERRKIMLSNIG